jgi:hypothetical protein
MRTTIVTVLALAVATIVTAQQTPTVGLAGRWGQGQRTLLDLTTGAKGSVSGTVYIYEGIAPRLVAPIGTGSFDAKAGLKLKGEAKRPDGSILTYVIEGTLEGETLSVSYTFDQNKGMVRLTRVPAP